MNTSQPHVKFSASVRYCQKIKISTGSTMKICTSCVNKIANMSVFDVSPGMEMNYYLEICLFG